MKKLFFTCLFSLLSLSAYAKSSEPQILLHTNMGDITLALNEKAAPKTVANFLQYVDSGFYSNTVFHRVIADFMIQGGGFEKDMTEKKTRAPIVNESMNGLKNLKGTIAMARTSDPDSATAQFFINVVDNDYLNANPGRAGYAVFGKVTKGMDVVERIAQVHTGTRGMFQDVPDKDVIILGIKRLP